MRSQKVVALRKMITYILVFNNYSSFEHSFSEHFWKLSSKTFFLESCYKYICRSSWRAKDHLPWKFHVLLDMQKNHAYSQVSNKRRCVMLGVWLQKILKTSRRDWNSRGWEKLEVLIVGALAFKFYFPFLF